MHSRSKTQELFFLRKYTINSKNWTSAYLTLLILTELNHLFLRISIQRKERYLLQSQRSRVMSPMDVNLGLPSHGASESGGRSPHHPSSFTTTSSPRQSWRLYQTNKISPTQEFQYFCSGLNLISNHSIKVDKLLIQKYSYLVHPGRKNDARRNVVLGQYTCTSLRVQE